MNKHTNKTSFKMGHKFIAGGEKGWFKSGVKNNVEEKHPHWKGECASYSSKHKWIYRHKKYPKRCVDCKKIKKLQWSNVDHKYRRNLKDYKARCCSCHRIYDKKYL